MKMLTKEQILLLHQDLIDAFGGESGLRDSYLLELAPEVPLIQPAGIDRCDYLGCRWRN